MEGARLAGRRIKSQDGTVECSGVSGGLSGRFPFSAVAAGKVAESFYRFNLTEFANVIFHANEWMTGMGALYIQKHVPEIATVFTTHATTVGRSIACNRKPLYDYLFAYDGDRMAEELNVRSKHSIETQTAQYADCFTTGSDITAR